MKQLRHNPTINEVPIAYNLVVLFTITFVLLGIFFLEKVTPLMVLEIFFLVIISRILFYLEQSRLISHPLTNKFQVILILPAMAALTSHLIW